MGVMEVVRAVDCNFCVLNIFMTAIGQSGGNLDTLTSFLMT